MLSNWGMEKSHSRHLATLFLLGGGRVLGGSSQEVVSTPSVISHLGHLEGEQAYLGDLQSGMVLQVPPLTFDKLFSQ